LRGTFKIIRRLENHALISVEALSAKGGYVSASNVSRTMEARVAIGSSNSAVLSRRRRSLFLLLLLFAFAFNFVDRQVLSVALEAIKGDLSLTDTELGLITGFAFAICYSLLGLPIARYADRGDRGRIISLSLLVLSLTAALTGSVSTFAQLVAVRLGAGAGEAGVVPASHSLVATLFARSERPRAMSVLLLGGPLSLVVGYAVGGWLIGWIGWRSTFLILALPGALLACVLHLAVSDPRHRPTDQSGVDRTGGAPTIAQIARRLLGQRTFRWLLIAYTADSLFGTGLVQWLPVFLIRSHHMSVEQVGIFMALSWGLAAAGGTFLGGRIIARRGAGFEQRQLMMMCGSASGYMLLTWLAIYLHGEMPVLAVLMISAAVYALANAPSFSLIQSLVPENMRATAVAAVFLLGNLIGLGLGPLAIGVLSDLLRYSSGADSVKFALGIVAPGYLIVAASYLMASRTVMNDLRDAETEHAT